MFIVAFGTRPEYIKLKPLMVELELAGIEFESIYIGQHEHLLSGCVHDHFVHIEESHIDRLNNITGSCLFHFSKRVKGVIVQGDTTTAMSVALSAFHQKIPVLHVEAGLRTYKNDPYPEEANRRIISSIASYNFAPSEKAYNNLHNENTPGKIYFTGNTGLDNLREYDISYNNYVMFTMHRSENVPKISEWFHQLNQQARRLKTYGISVFYPMHPNPEIQKHKHILENVVILDPLDHESMADLLSSCRFAITDSGGIQEECRFFNKWCIVCRTSTERPCSSNYLIDNPSDLASAILYCYFNDVPIDDRYDFGDGYASKKIVQIIKEEFK